MWLLDKQLPAPAYGERFQTLRAVVMAGAVNVLSGSRLIDRAQQAPQRYAWKQQGVGIAHAQDAYSRAGTSDDLTAAELTQLIVLTRLIRATMALTIAVLHPTGRH
ncbi:MAG: hypothetical protein ITG02_12435 [Patulibacter sp.]|nr:hypothetical protein [Patulibacter sp.]